MPAGHRGRCRARATETRLAAEPLGGDLVDRNPRRDSAPSVLSGWVPVRKLASDRAWSPPRRRGASALCWARPVMTSRSSLKGASGSRVSGRLEVRSVPWETSRHVNAVGDVEERHPPRHGAAARRRRWCGRCRQPHGFQPGQSDGHPQPRKSVRLDSRFGRSITSGHSNDAKNWITPARGVFGMGRF